MRDIFLQKSCIVSPKANVLLLILFTYSSNAIYPVHSPSSGLRDYAITRIRLIMVFNYWVRMPRIERTINGFNRDSITPSYPACRYSRDGCEQNEYNLGVYLLMREESIFSLSIAQASFVLRIARVLYIVYPSSPLSQSIHNCLYIRIHNNEAISAFTNTAHHRNIY